MIKTTKTTAGRRMAREPKLAQSKPVKVPSKLDQIEALLCTGTGATIAELMDATTWQQHSIRGALAGAIKKRGLVVSSEKIDGVRRYRAVRAPQ